jgi:two-component system response regulator DevR
VVNSGNGQREGRPSLGGGVTVYVVDDHGPARAALVELIGSMEGLVVVGSSGAAPEALADIVRLRPQVVVLDAMLGDGQRDGLDVCRALRVAAPEAACVIVTAGVATSWGRAEARDAGAAAYLLKQVKDFPLASVIRRVAAGARLA